MTTILASRRVCAPGPSRPGWVAVDGDRIVDVASGDAPADADDLGGAVLAPAFIDLQCNGTDDVDLATADADGWQRVGETLARHGVASYCPTFVTRALDEYTSPLEAAASARDLATPGAATILGVHLEGPFLGGAPGAHDPALVRAVDVDWLAVTLARHPGLVRIVTLAPEADPGFRATTALVDMGVVVALGHTTATYDDALDAADAGATVVTHLFNGMSPFHHRDPGVVGAALDDERLTPTLIADLVHLHPAALRLAFARVPSITVVSDAVGVGPGVATDVATDDGAATRGDGTLLGATTLLDGALANVVGIGIPVERAVASVTAAPARLLGLDDRGTLREGARADLVALDPTTMEVRRVWLGGTELVDGVR
jgi:N-acetylglucosamine-6-phosphate deacetylase